MKSFRINFFTVSIVSAHQSWTELLFKLDTEGNLIWTTTLSTNNTLVGDVNYKLTATNDGGAIFGKGNDFNSFTTDPDYPTLWKVGVDGNIQSGECGEIQMDLMLDCDATLGAAYCIESHIYPDSLCSPVSTNWNGAFVEVSGTCQGASVEFQIENTGNGDMTQEGEYIIVADAVLLMMSNFNLPSGQSTPVSFPANGSTYYMMSTQEPFAPGNPHPIASIEGCGTNSSGTFSVNYLNQFSQGDSDPFIDIDCREATSSFDPNDKQGFPIGYDSDHFMSLIQIWNI